MDEPEFSARTFQSAYHNRDLAPIAWSERKWGLKDIAALWIGMAACVPTYMLASSLIDGGMNWWQAVSTIFLGNCIVLVPMVLNAHAGTKYGIPFPVYCRAAFGMRGAKEGAFWAFFIPDLTANVGFWATLSLNIPDFTRYAYSQRDQVLGQALGLPTTMALYSFIGVAVTSGTLVIYGQAIWDPVDLISRFTSPVVLLVALVSLCLATLATNIAANIVSPANDFSNLWPRRISFRTGGLITGLIGMVICPWKLVEDPSGYIFQWLVAYSSLLGAIGGILFADYYFVRRTRLDLYGLYSREGPYWYVRGFNPAALVALLAGIAPCIPGFLATVELIEVPEIWTDLYHYAWFISFAASFVVYLALMGTSTRSK